MLGDYGSLLSGNVFNEGRCKFTIGNGIYWTSRPRLDEERIVELDNIFLET